MADSASPLLGSMAAALTNSRKSPLSGAQTDRALGAAASLCLSLAILRWVHSTYKAVKRLEQEPVADHPELVVIKQASLGNTNNNGDFYSWFRQFLRRLLLDDYEHDSLKEQTVSASDGAIITHQGACHCESVQFEMIAPRCLAAEDGPGKIQYRHTQVKSSNFRVVRGQDCLKTYYVVSKKSSSRGAHAFCERCGVHILYAPCKNSPNLHINVLCVSEGIRKVRVTDSLNIIADGVPLEGQWDDQLSTISEVTQDSRYMFPATESSLSGDWRAYDRVEEPQPVYATTPAPTPINVVAGVPGTSITASTVDSLTAPADSLLRIIPAIEPSSCMSVTTELDNMSNSPRSYNVSSSASTSTSTTAIPQMRDQMKFFMKKHISSSASTNSTLTSSTEAMTSSSTIEEKKISL